MKRVRAKKESKKETFVLEVSQKDYERELAQGVDAGVALKPGKHVFRRGTFRDRHPGFDPAKAEVKIRVNMYLDRDIVAFFKERAAKANAAPYQTQINAALRSFVEGRIEESTEFSKLLRNEKFMDAIAERLREKTS